MFLLWLASAALAGQLYINGVLVHPPQVAGTTLEKVDVTFDAAGNVRVVAPGYKIEVVEPPPATVSSAPPGPQPAGTFAPAGSYAPGAATPGVYPPAAVAPVGAAAVAPSQLPPAPGMHPSGLARAKWWLVTEDNGSRGHSVEVVVNGQVVQTVRSGEATRIIDMGSFLRPGSNRVVLRSMSTDAGGGTMYVYIGSGSDESGTVVMDTPQVQFGLGASRSGSFEREYSFDAR